MSRFACLIVVLAALGCGSGTSAGPRVLSERESERTIAASLGTPFALRVGQSAHLASESLTLLFRSVAEDSRCPEDVDCVWEGNARLILEVTRAGNPTATVVLNTALDPITRVPPREAEYLHYRIELLSLEPARGEQRVIAQEDYLAHLVVTAP